MHTLTTLIDSSCRLLLERHTPTLIYLRISRPGAALTGIDGDVYTLHIRAQTLEEAFDQAATWLAEGEGYATEQAARHPGGEG